MKIEIRKQGESRYTSVKVDGVEISGCVSGLTLTLRADEVPTLNLEIRPIDSMDIRLPSGIVMANQEPPE